MTHWHSGIAVNTAHGMSAVITYQVSGGKNLSVILLALTFWCLREGPRKCFHNTNRLPRAIFFKTASDGSSTGGSTEGPQGGSARRVHELSLPHKAGSAERIRGGFHGGFREGFRPGVWTRGSAEVPRPIATRVSRVFFLLRWNVSTVSWSF